MVWCFCLVSTFFLPNIRELSYDVLRMKKEERGNGQRPTDAELAIMRVLWITGKASVRQVWEKLNEGRENPVVYTTVLKSMQVMQTKGLLNRDDSQRSHLYYVSQSPEKTKRQLVADFVHRLFEGSARDLMAHALGGRRLRKGELDEIRELIDQLEAKNER